MKWETDAGDPAKEEMEQGLDGGEGEAQECLDGGCAKEIF